MTMQKDKGKKFENKIAEFIHQYLYDNIVEYQNLYEAMGNVNLKPRREKSSGTAKEADNDVDLGLAMKFFPYSVECKHHKCISDVTLNTLMDEKFGWIDKVMEQAETHGKIKKLTPLIVFRGNRTLDFCCINIEDLKKQSLTKFEVIQDKIKNHAIYKGKYFICELEKLMKYLIYPFKISE